MVQSVRMFGLPEGVFVKMKVLAYRVVRDFGFAPNPFNGLCTLATCKPRIRNSANIGDWILGSGSAGYNSVGMLIYAMKVTEKITYNQYWEDERFQFKKPVLNGSLKRAFGDNIYHRDAEGIWVQQNSHHSHEDGSMNMINVSHDTQSQYVLIADNFSYFGKSFLPIPVNILAKVWVVRNHKKITNQDDVRLIEQWLESLDRGYLDDPNHFNIFKRYKGSTK